MDYSTSLLIKNEFFLVACFWINFRNTALDIFRRIIWKLISTDFYYELWTSIRKFPSGKLWKKKLIILCKIWIKQAILFLTKSNFKTALFFQFYLSLERGVTLYIKSPLSMVVMCIVSWNRSFGPVENVEMFTDEQIDECWIKWDQKSSLFLSYQASNII